MLNDTVNASAELSEEDYKKQLIQEFEKLKAALLIAPAPLNSIPKIEHFSGNHELLIHQSFIYDADQEFPPRAQTRKAYLIALTQLVMDLDRLGKKIVEPCQSPKSAWCDEVPTDIMQLFNRAEIQCYNELIEEVARVFRSPIIIGSSEVSYKDVIALTNVINSLQTLHKDPTDEDAISNFSNNITTSQTSTFKFIAGSLLYVLGFAIIIAAIPAALSYGLILGLTIGILGTFTGFMGGALREASTVKKYPAFDFFQNKHLMQRGEELEKASRKVQSASGRYGMFNGLCNLSTMAGELQDTGLHNMAPM